MNSLSHDTRTTAHRPGRQLQRLAVAALALCRAAGGARAQGRHDDDRRGPPGHGERFANGHDNRRSDRDHRHDHYDRQDFRDGRHFDRRGYEPRPAEWRRGGRLPPEYRGRNYVVNDYRVYRLQPPPRGYQWVGVGGEFALAAIATGIIAQIVVSR